MGLTDKHLAYGDDVPQTQTEKDCYWKIKHLEEENNKLKEAVVKIKEEIKADRFAFYLGWNGEKIIEIINKHMEGLV